jgi:hypothetical protein
VWSIVVDRGFCCGTCGDREADTIETVDSAGEEGEEVRWDGFRPTGGAAFLDIELVDDAAERRRSSFFATSGDAEPAGLMVEAGTLFKDV